MDPTSRQDLAGARVVVGVSGGIAAYKAAHLVRGLVASGADVQVIPTPSSLAFVGAATWEALSHRKVITSVFEDVEEVAHVAIGQQADLVIVAPATADLLARGRMGRADDLLTATLLVTRAPVLLAPAMHTEMWENPATVENVAVLHEERGMHVLEPAVGRLTGPDTGPGRLPEPEAILEAARALIGAPRRPEGRVSRVHRDLQDVRVVITAGGTREDLDPVRFLANHSSGKQGWALAHAALVRGAAVTLIAANVDLQTPPGAERIDVRSAADLAAAVDSVRERTDVLVMAAAVADFTAADRAAQKIKKDETAGHEDDVPTIALRRTRDVLRTAVEQRGDASHPVIIGFAAETGSADASALDLARAKARRKGADLLVFNDVSGEVFGAEENAVSILDADGEVLGEASGGKTTVAHSVLDALVARRGDVPWDA